jgi:hypothetical protein
MLSSAERILRPPKPPVLTDFALIRYGDLLQFPIDVVTVSKFPRRAAHAKLMESVRPAANLTSDHSTHDDRTKRIMREVSRQSAISTLGVTILFKLKALMADPHPQIDVYVNNSDISFLKIIMEVCMPTSGIALTDTADFTRHPKIMPIPHTVTGRSFSYVTFLKPILAILQRLGFPRSSCIPM